MLVDLLKRGPEYLKERGFVDGDEVGTVQYSAVQYRTMQCNTVQAAIHTPQPFGASVSTDAARMLVVSLSMQLFYTQLNALLVKDAEEYYRNTMSGGNITWNIRDKVLTLDKQSLQHNVSKIVNTFHCHC